MSKLKKASKVISPFLWAIKISWQSNWRLFLATSLSTFLTSSVSGIINTYLIAQTTASVAQLALGQVTIRTPIIWATSFGVFNLFVDITRRINSYYDNKFNDQLNIDISSLYTAKVSSFTQEQLDNPKLQTSLSMAGRELYSIRNAARTLQDIGSSLTAYLLAVIVVWQYAWGIGLLLLILVPILAISNFYQTKRRRLSWEESSIHWRIAAGLFNYITDPLKLFEIRIMGARENILKLRKYHLTKELEITLKAERKNTYLASIEDLASPLIEIGTRIWAIMLVGAGKLAFDQFLFVIGLIQQASSQTFLLGYGISNAQETYLATESLKKVLDIPSPPDGDVVMPEDPMGVNIELKDTSLKYSNRTVALKDIYINVPAGSKIAIVGENGAGKTSLLRLITKQYEPSSGEMLVQNVDSRDLNRGSYYGQISVLSQDYYLFDDLTIRQNLQVVANHKLSSEEIYDALDLVNLKGKIKSLKHGLNTRLDKSYEDGSDLSGGQRQRLSIARALLKPYKLLILDEPTSSIDAKAERSIFNNIMQKSQNATVLIVSHRFATVRKADYIYVLDNSKVVEHGKHDELMKNNGLYAEMYTIQAEDLLHQ